MKKIIQSVLLLLLFITTASAQIIRPFTSRYYNASVRGNIVYVSNNIISTSGVGSGNPGTGEVPPAGSTSDNAGNGIDIDIDNPAPVTKLNFGSVWNYQAFNAAPPNDPFFKNWKQVGYILSGGQWNVGGVPVNGPGDRKSVV